MKPTTFLRLLCAMLALLLSLTVMTACSDKDDLPKGYQNATCNGETFRLYVPTQWTLNTESGVSGAHYSLAEGAAVSMTEVDFAMADATATATLVDFAKAHKASVSEMKGFTLIKDSLKTETAEDGTVTESCTALLGKYQAYDITYSATVGEDTYYYYQLLVKANQRFYLFTYSAKGEEIFNRWLIDQPVVAGILENITFEAKAYDGGEHDRKLPKVETPEGMKLVTGNDVAYRFFAPENWVVGDAESAALVYASASDRSNVSVMGYVPDEEGYSVDDYWAYTEASYKDALHDYTLLFTTEGKLGGKNAKIYEYTYTLGGTEYKCRQVISVYSYMIVTMTYTAEPENYDAHISDVEAMQSALTFRTPVIG